MSSTHRKSVEELRNRPAAKVLIVGGGINGVGTFRDLALQGVDVALVERGDYCQGASGASSHMIHGGIRYLENGEFRLVRESVVERNRLLNIAPHYVKPLQTTIPIFSTFSGILSAPARFLTHKQGKPKERGAFLIKLGLSIYDSFSRDGGTVPRHQFRGRDKALAELPQLHPGIKYAATYFDASVHNPERLTLDVLQDGEKAGRSGGTTGGTNQARATNYVSLVSMGPAPAAGSTPTVVLRDELTGETFDFSADVIVNTTGAWVDQTNTAMGSASSFMGGTKGSHIVLDHPALLAACNGREIFFEHTDGRIVLIYPLGDRVLVGTTDIDADMSEDAVCTDAEIDYFFDLIGHVFPTVEVTREQIVYTFSGVRPLPRHDDTQPGFVSRDYRIERRTAGATEGTGAVLSLVGGKWTTFRALAEHLTNDVLAELGVARKVSTAKLPIGGGAGFPSDEAGVQQWIKTHMAAGRDADRTAGLLTRYGTRAVDVMAYLDGGEDRPLRSTRELSRRELEFMAANEQIGHLIDVFIRRTSLAFRGLVTGELLNEAAEVLSGPLGWDRNRSTAEIKHAQEVLQRLHRVQIDSLVA
ncbi:glycerol-3-phosphate dehydrogenase/oxidase [Pseudarthrobacter sp. J75]|uniref:glycerol-3-phosphate dehydrogenase/oxidase n=1 Tax=unclassified Pseudarthrobacter TaxID=2647000 RepID=UPI002E823BD8|nr:MULTISPECIES: glycerol-3-phosphate dehydrogenase/oxidase [unclassified Pseudarthrobacter]MEE2523352.1 glycerol-3-phosphate dehydrogenase/oxidase [Pseudarthrobacter sp. J47]MEE2529317.1 glycerol-3-phosphate dehydrogenase/oxidase [Pseudarthrobacter sp. J75]